MLDEPGVACEALGVVRRGPKIVAAAVAGFLVPATLIVFWALAVDSTECDGDECALEFAAVITGAIVTGSLVAAACGFVMYALTGPRDNA